MIFTATFKALGDFLEILPVASWYYKTKGEKIHWVLSSQFPSYIAINELLLYQDFTDKVSYIDRPANHFQDGSWEWLNPSDYGIEGENRNWGFWKGTWPPPTQYMGEYWGDHFGYGCDPDFVLKIPKMECPTYNTVWVDARSDREDHGALKHIMLPDAYELKTSDPIIYNANISLKAKHVWSPAAAWAIFMDLAGKDINILLQRVNYPSTAKMCYRRNHNIIIL